MDNETNVQFDITVRVTGRCEIKPDWELVRQDLADDGFEVTAFHATYDPTKDGDNASVEVTVINVTGDAESHNYGSAYDQITGRIDDQFYDCQEDMQGWLAANPWNGWCVERTTGKLYADPRDIYHKQVSEEDMPGRLAAEGLPIDQRGAAQFPWWHCHPERASRPESAIRLYKMFLKSRGQA